MPLTRPFFSLLLLSLVFGVGSHAVVAAEADRPQVDLDAAALSPGPLLSWSNAGTAGGEFTAEAKTAPKVDEVGGKRAVTFGNDRWMTSSFKAPAEITGGHAFTVALWAFEPQPAERDVMISWASRPLRTAEFGWGPRPDGAFFGWDKMAKFTHLPGPGAWHYIVYTYAADHFHVYVDGVLDVTREFTLSPKPGGRIYLGGGWNAEKQKPVFSFRGSLARVQIWDRALSAMDLRNAAGWYGCFSPQPDDGSIVPADGTTTLRWEPGRAETKSFKVVVAADEANAARDASDAKEVHTQAAEFKPPGISPGHTYFWRVDQLDAQGKQIEKGKVWHFATDNGPATSPTPHDRIANIPLDLKTLSWTPGRYATGQQVFFGPDRDAVVNGSAALVKDLGPKVGSCPLPPSALEQGKTYYWRVQENNGAIPAAMGTVWAFRTPDKQVPDDITFFVGSDCHYGRENNDELNRQAIAEMNWLPGTPVPTSMGQGVVKTPRGVVINGDLLDNGTDPKTAPENWAEWTHDYGLTGHDGLLVYPVLEGFGNHDGMTGKSISRAGILERNRHRPGLTMVSSNGYHYSWDWDQMHGVQLNLFPGKDSKDCTVAPPNHDPEDALGFLKEDLAKNVTDRNRIVVIFCHYCYSGGMADWWTDAAKQRFYDAVQGYRVILIHGHSHGAYFYTWKGIPAISDGATARPELQTGDFLWVHLTKDQLSVAQRKMGSWGITLQEPLPGVAGAPVKAVH